MREKFGSRTLLEFRGEDKVEKWILIVVCVRLLPSNDIRTNRWSMSISSYFIKLLRQARDIPPRFYCRHFLFGFLLFCFTPGANER